MKIDLTFIILTQFKSENKIKIYEIEN